MLPEQKDQLLWVYPKIDQKWKQEIIKEFKIHPVTAQILVSRGFESLKDIHDYLYAKLPDLHDPFLLADMQKAVERIEQACKKEEPILIYGDNDVDGMTATALLVEFLQLIGATVFFYISTPGTPRQSMIVDALGFAKEQNCKLLITVDCGITAATEIAKFVEEGIDVIITDHHEPTDRVPHCVATLNPKLLNNQYPNRHLTGVGVAFKLAHGIANYFAEIEYLKRKIDLKRFLDLVALGTLSDMGPLRGENRILVRYGIKQLHKTKRIGLAKLVSVCDLDLTRLNTYNLSTRIAPRLNSLGRIADPNKGVELLLIRNIPQAEKLAKELDLYNIERQKIEKTMSVDVENILKTYPEIVNDNAIVLASEKWHPGIIAIISTRISKQYNRPTVIIAIDNGVGKGSVRSIPEFPLLEVLKESEDILTNYGGHDFAAGLSIAADKIDLFRERFIKAANKKLQQHDIMTKLHIDAKVDFEDLNFECMESMTLLEPFGNENPPPILYSDATQAWPPKVIGKAHLKLYLQQKDRLLEGLALGRASASPFLRKRDLTLEVAFSPQMDIFRDDSCIKLMIRDFKVKEPGP